MTLNWTDRVSRLRRSAIHCRVLAQGALSPRLQSELEALAASYDAEADALEHRQLPQGRHRSKVAG